MKEAVVESRLAEQAFDDLFGNPVKVRELVDGELKKHQIKGRNQRAAAGHALRMRLLQEAEAQRDKTIQSLEFQVQGLLSHLVTEAEGIADTAFLKILKNSSAPDPRIRYFEEYSYTVMTATESNKFILGDCGVVAIQSDGRPKLAFANVDKTVLLDEIWLPVSPDLAIVGRRTDRVHLLSSVDVNRCSAQLSLEFFISHNHDAEEIDEYRALIGTSDPFLTEEELCALSLGRAG